MRCIVIFLIYLTFSVPCYAQQREVNISYFRDLALTRSPAVSIGQQRVEAAKGRQVQAGRYPNTRVGYHANEIGMHGSDGVQVQVVDLQLWWMVEQPLCRLRRSYGELH